MRTHLRGGSADLLFLHARPPTPLSASPHSRQVFRRARLLHQLIGGRLIVASLDEPSDAERRILERSGLHHEVLPSHATERLSELMGNTRAWWVTDLTSARALQRAMPEGLDPRPALAELDTLPSLEIEASATRPGARNTDGLDHLHAATRAREAEALSRFTVLAVAGHQLAEVLSGLEGLPQPRIVSPCTSPMLERREASQRHGVLHYGSWVSEFGHPDEDGLWHLMEWLADSNVAVEQVLSQDAPPHRRAALLDGIEVLAPESWAKALRTARVVVLPRRGATARLATVAELVASEVPFLADPSVLAGLPSPAAGPHLVVEDPEDWPDRIEQLLTIAPAWNAQREHLRQLATHWLDPGAVAAQTSDLLDLLGIEADGALAEAPEDQDRAVPCGPSAAGSMRSMLDLRTFERRLLGPHRLTRMASLSAQNGVTADDGYRLWRAAHTEGTERLAQLGHDAEGFTYRPVISIVMPTYNSDPLHLMEALASVSNQTWPHWELCVADDGSPDPATRAAIERARHADSRVKLTVLDRNRGIAAATNAALGLAQGTFVGFLDHDDLLDPTALHWIVELLQDHPDLDVIYTDEDRLDPQGRHAQPSFKPDWSPDLLLCTNYVSHFTVIRRSLVEELGGLRSGFDDAQDYDLVLRVTEHTDRVGHVARPLYSWRQTDRSTATSSDAKPRAHDAGRLAVEEALARRNIDAHVLPGYVPTWHHLRFPVAEQPLVSILIPTRDHVHLLASCIDGLRRTCEGTRYEIVVIDNDSSAPETLTYLREAERDPDCQVVRYPARFNYARQMNLGAVAANGDLLLLLNNDCVPQSDGWLQELTGHALRPEVGAVGARLVRPDGTVQHEGIALNIGEAPAWNTQLTGHPTLSRNVRNTAAVTGACLLTRRNVFESVAGMDEQLRVAFNDVDFCRRVGELGYRIVYTPWAELEHDESASRGLLHPDDDELFYRRRWGGPELIRDPFWSTSLDMAHPVARFRL